MDMDLVLGLFILAFSVVVHEVAHGHAAYLLGDTTARDANRLNFSPMAHVDPFGSILLPALLVMSHSPVLLGWAKPVPVNPANFANPRRGMMLVGAAGPMSNLLLAAVAGGLFRLLHPGSGVWQALLGQTCVTNVILAVFNLIPLPPLDGSRIVMGLLPRPVAEVYGRVERYGTLILFALLWFGGFGKVVAPVARFLLKLLLG